MANAVDPASLTEPTRLAALRSLALLDTPPSEAFDRVTRLAAKIIDVPIALVSLVDESRQWFKSRFGIDVEETARDISLCTHVIAQRRPLLIPDTTLDARFAASPLVTSSPHIRAYAGIPLFTVEGHAVGTLCALDQRPREFTQDDIDALTDLAQILEDAIQARELAAHTEHVLHFAQDRERLFRDTFDMAAAGVVHVALSGKLMRVNQCVCELLGYTAAELETLSVIDLTHPEDIARAADAFHRACTGIVDRYHIDKRLQRKDRTYIWCHLSVAAKRSIHGAAEYVIAVIEDIAVKHQAADEMASTRDHLLKEVANQAQRIHDGSAALRTHVKNLLISEQSVRRVEQRLRAIANSVPAMIGYWNRNLECEFANEAYREWFGLAPENIVGMTMKDLLGATFEATAPHVQLALEGREQRFDRRQAKFDGTESFLDIRYMPDRDEATTEVRGFFVLVTDQTSSRHVQQALQSANAKLTNDSAIDALTGLANRQVFHLRGEDAAKHFKKRHEVYALILLDLANFRQLDESHGHEQSEKLLRAVAGTLKAQLRSHRDVAARLGNEEFAILCFGALDEELLLHIAQTIETDLAALQLTASFGLTISRDPPDDWRNSYSVADNALREAKRPGKNRIIVGRIPLNAALTP